MVNTPTFQNFKNDRVWPLAGNISLHEKLAWFAPSK